MKRDPYNTRWEYDQELGELAEKEKKMKETVSFDDCVALTESSSGLALKIQFPDREEAIWIPQSQIDDDSEIWHKGHKGTLVITRWIAEQKGLV